MIEPLYSNILVRRVTAPDRTPGGLILTAATKEKPTEADVLAVGTGRLGEDGTVRPLVVKVGDRVLFGKFVGNEVRVGDEDLLILREEDVLGIVRG